MQHFIYELTYPEWAFWGLLGWGWGGKCPRSISPEQFGVQTKPVNGMCLAQVYYGTYVVMTTNYDVINCKTWTFRIFLFLNNINLFFLVNFSCYMKIKRQYIRR
jgi:hypothetical protein